MTQKDAGYHRAAVQYNEELAKFAFDLANRLENEEVSRWAKAVGKHHAFHAGRHRKSLERLENKKEGKTRKTAKKAAAKNSEKPKGVPRQAPVGGPVPFSHKAPTPAIMKSMQRVNNG